MGELYSYVQDCPKYTRKVQESNLILDAYFLLLQSG